MKRLGSIFDALVECVLCKQKARVGDCIPDVDGDGSLGCPRPDCGGIMWGSAPPAKQFDVQGNEL